jgi:AmmeMemoRadiSam system protein B
MNVRTPVVAGSFYPGTAPEINLMVDRILASEKSGIDYSYAEKEIIGCVVPHAGYVYSAYEALHFFEILRKSGKKYDTFVIINPNHTGYGEAIELDSHDAWRTPLGRVDLDRELIGEMDLPAGTMAQSQEHSAEVMLPLLQKTQSYPYKILPISILKQNPDNARELAGKLKKASEKLERKIMLIASSDFSHFESPEDGHAKDDLVLEQIRDRNTDKLYETVIRNRISVCGYGPIMTLMEYAGLVSEDPRSAILARGHSGKTRPSGSVVDYITILFHQ